MNCLFVSSILLLVAVWTSSVQGGCAPVEEGKDVTIDCSGSLCRGGVVRWVPGNSSSVCRCLSLSFTACVCPSSNGLYSSRLTRNGNNFTSTLTFRSLSRATWNRDFSYEGPWSCHISNCPGSASPIQACPELEVYVKPVNPTCALPQIVQSGSQASIQVRCNTSKVFPQAKCLFFVSSDGAAAKTSSGSIALQHQPVGNNFTSECTLTVPVNNLGVGTHSFHVKMYPDVTNGVDVGVNSSSVHIALTLPETRVAIAGDVVRTNSYVKGRSVNVTCELTSDGNPKGQARWFGSNGVELPNQGDGDSSTHRFSADDGSRPVCKGKSPLALSSPKSFTHQFAFVDDDALSLVIKDGKTSLCSHSGKVVVKCQVDKSKANPAPMFQFSTDGQNYDAPVQGSDNGGFWEREFTIQNGGEFTVHCRVTNTIFSSLRKDKSLPLTVNESPSSAPSIRINNTNNFGQNNFTAKAGENVNITCQVSGGYPPANLALTCGQDGSNTSTGIGSASLNNLTLTPEMDGTKCVCTGTHDSGCYSNNTSELLLSILYEPDVNISAGTGTGTEQKTGSLIVNRRSKVILTCVADGNPTPTVTLSRPRIFTVERLEEKSGSLSYEIPSASCDDTGVYTCSASNSQGRSVSRMNVFVHCPFSRGYTRSRSGGRLRLRISGGGDDD